MTISKKSCLNLGDGGLMMGQSFGEVPMRFRSDSDEVPMEIGGK